jgi:hypothetical protein
MAAGLRILLVSPDLMAISRLAALARQAEGTLESLRSLDASPREDGYDLVLIDLQGMADDPALLVSRVRTSIAGRDAVGPRVVAFGPHVATARLEQARTAGADDAVSRGELLGAFPALLRRWCPRS